MGQVIRDNPNGGSFKTNKPVGANFTSNAPISGGIDSQTEGNVYLENKTIRVGEPMGLLLTLTYPETVNFMGERL